MNHDPPTDAADARRLSLLFAVLNLAGFVIVAGASVLRRTDAAPWLIVFLGLAAFTAQAVWSGSPLAARLWIFGTTVGCAELVADAWLVRATRTLAYPAHGPMVLASPLYMPHAWGGILLSFVLAGRHLAARVGVARAAAPMALAAGLYLNAYEQAAVQLGWWRYAGAPSPDGRVPTYIGVAEFVLALPLAFVGARIAGWRRRETALAGVAFGLWIFAAYAACFATWGRP